MTATGAAPWAGRAFRIAGGAGVVGSLLVVLGFLLDPRQAAFAFLAAWSYWHGLALGALLLVMIHHAMNSSWFVVLRRPAEAAAATMPLLAILFVPVLLAMGRLYPWVAPGAALTPELAEALERERIYLNVPFFAIRAALYFGIWTLAALLLRRWSIRQEVGDGVALARRQRTLAAVMLPPVGFALTFAAFDWLMSLSPAWSSTVFGVYVFAGDLLAALSLLAIVAWALERAGAFEGAITVSHVHALGKLILTFVVFWAYIAFAQLLLIWIADVPAEARWYAVRSRGGWSAIAGVLVFGHFLLPFFALLSRSLKRRASALAAVAGWLLVMHAVDVYWLVLPALHPDGVRPHWLDPATFVGVGGLVVDYGVRLLAAAPLVPRGDPRLERSRRFITT